MSDQSGMIAPGNIDLSNRPRIKNADGSISTVRSIGVNIDGKEVLIPTVIGDKVVSNDEAIKEYHRTGQHLGVFDTPKHASAFAQSLHEREAAKLSDEQNPTGVPDGWSVVQGGKSDAPTRGKGHDFKVLGINIHVPAEEQPRADSNIIGGNSGAGVAPEDVLMAGQAAKRVVSAAPGIASKIAATMGEVAPMVKYEAVKTALRATGLPEPAAAIIAGAVVGIRGKGKAAAAEAGPVDAEAAHLDRSVPVQPSKLTPQQLKERFLSGTGTPPAVNRGPGGRPLKTPLPVAVEAAPAVEAEALAKMPAGTDVRQPTAKPTMTAAQSKAYLKLRADGKSDAQSRSILEASRTLNEALGLSTPTAAETRFPKGMRGGAPQ